MLDDMFDYLENIRERPVWQPIPEETRAHFHAPVPVEPTPLAELHQQFMRDVVPSASGNTHPGFMGWVQGGGNPVGMLAEMLAAGLNANLGGRDHMPIEVERQILRWVRELFGFPEGASGIFVTGTSMANLISVLVARTAALGPEVRRKGIGGSGQHLTAYASSSVHGCVAQAIDLAGIGRENLRVIPVDACHRIDLAALEKAIAQDRAHGFRPFLVIGTAGTVDIGATDDLDGLADIAARERLWFHVDGAFGALGILSPEIAPRLKGIERADSLAFDFHKWAQVPYDAGFVLVRDGELHRNTFASPAVYLRRETRGLAAGPYWPCDYGPDLSRGFRALKTWFTLKAYGTKALGRVIERGCELARYLASRIEAEPELELLAPVQLNIVCFGYRCADPDHVNAAITVRLQEQGKVAPSSTTVDGRLAIRAGIFNHRTEERDIDALIEGTLLFGRELTG